MKISSFLKPNLRKNFKNTIVSISMMGIMLGGSAVNAATPSEKLNQINGQLGAARNELSRLHGEKSSLSNEVASLDAHIQELQLQIEQAQAQIEEANAKIDALRIKIEETQKEIDRQKAILAEYLKTMYLNGQVSLAEELLKSDSFSDFVDQNEYLNTMQRNVKEATDKIVALKAELEGEKKNIESSKAEIEKLKAAQVNQREAINQQKAAKERLLAAVQSDESKYQSYVGSLQQQQAAVQSEIARIAAAASTPRGIFGGGYKSYGRVNKGDVIGYQGNSGYSTGTHLHFELRVGGGDTNPWPYVQNGTFANPLPGGHITQYWGETGNLAGYYRHTGMDISAGYGAPIRAAMDGEIIARVTGQGNTYPGQVSYGNYVMIRHSNGWVTIYGHMQ